MGKRHDANLHNQHHCSGFLEMVGQSLQRISCFRGKMRSAEAPEGKDAWKPGTVVKL